MIGIYKITNKINNNSYIGLSTHIEDRSKYHRDPYNWNRESNKLLYSSFPAGVTKMRVYLWIEGQDIDCENNASGGKISFDLQITSSLPDNAQTTE